MIFILFEKEKQNNIFTEKKNIEDIDLLISLT